MSVDEALRGLAGTIESGQPWPRPRCPSCDAGHVGFDEPTKIESHESASARDHPAFDPEWISGTFIVRGKCENPGCQQVVHGSGDYAVDVATRTVSDDPYYQGLQWSDYFRVIHVHPTLHLMPVPEAAPEEVRDGVLRASRVLLVDPGLAATALRAAVERLLTFENISATTPKGRFRPAHDRIEEWRDVNPPERSAIADLFFAVKWLGNAGTHEDADLTMDEVLSGAKLLDEAFHRLYTGPDLDTQAQTINLAQGPHR